LNVNPGRMNGIEFYQRVMGLSKTMGSLEAGTGTIEVLVE